MQVKRKQKPCAIKSCRALFTPISSFHKVCSPKCGLEKARLDKAKEIEKKRKAFDRETRKMKAAMNDADPSFWSEKAQRACHEYIKYRDAGKPCISCGTTKATIKYDAGHFIPRGRSAALRFEITNIARQCSWYCNENLSGNCIEYRKALVKKYGIAHVEWLEGPHEMPRYRIEDYKRIYAEFKAMTKQLKLDRGIA